MYKSALRPQARPHLKKLLLEEMKYLLSFHFLLILAHATKESNERQKSKWNWYLKKSIPLKKSLLTLAFRDFFAFQCRSVSQRVSILAFVHEFKLQISNSLFVSPCQGTSPTESGTCFTSPECANKGGSSIGNCASGFGVCCTFRISVCGSTIREVLEIFL